MDTKIILVVFLSLILIPGALGLASVSQLGYHTDSTKQATIYTSQSSGTFSLRNINTNTIVFQGSLSKAKDYNGNPVECQGNNPCLVADFTNYKNPGTYKIETLGFTSSNFKINDNVFEENAPIFLEFFDALLQQNSSYHKDLHSYANPAFSLKADGSFIMEAHQATISLMRLGRAYRENPTLWNIDVYSPLRIDTPDMLEHIVIYADYIRGLQGVQIQERTDGVGFRLNPSMKINNAFVPGPTNLKNLDVYIPGSPPQYLSTVSVASMCAPHDNTARWNQCIKDAELYFKCQIDEPCLNMSYIERTGVLVSNNQGYGVSRGWGYEFGCYQDINLNQEMYSTKHNPCAIFYPDVTRAHTIEGMTAYLYALPAINDYDTALAYEYFGRSVNTYNYIKSNFNLNFGSNDDDAGYYGAGLFLLYEYTGNLSYLQEAHSMRNVVSKQLISDRTKGPNMYWHEYARNKDAIISNNLEYPFSGQTPEGLLRGKMFFDYKDRGGLSIGRNAERVFEFDRNVQFQNSRFMLMEGLFALQTLDLHPSPETFIKVIADSQLAWITGNNGVQAGTSIGSPIKSYSFIFGIGSNNPQQFHSRYLVNTGYSAASNGNVVGARGTGYQFLDNITKSVTYSNASSSDFVYLDAKFNILGQTIGSLGNRWRNETYNNPFKVGTTFANGKPYIPGWINGAYDTFSDSDIIFNYRDSVDTYEFTETTNEMVAIAMEYFSMIDRYYNNKPVHQGVKFNLSDMPPPPPEEPPEEPPAACYNSVESIPAICNGGTITTEATLGGGKRVICEQGTSSLHITAWNKNNQYFEMYKQSESGSNIEICLADYCIKTLGSGFQKSANFPICTGDEQPPEEPPEEPPVEPPIDPPEDNQTYCVTKITEHQVTCTGGTIISDTFDGCRKVTCSSGANNLQVMACDKPGSYQPTHFEIYRQTYSGTGISICFSGVCLDPRITGFVRSDYPVCNDNQTVPPLPEEPPEEPPTEPSEPGSLNNVTLKIAQWYPKGRDYIFICDAGSTATSYDFIFGDGARQLGTTRSDVYHKYSSSGNYLVSCTARNATHEGKSNLSIAVI